MVEVTNLANGRSLMVRINDRGPFIGGRLIDMSARGAQLLGFKEQGHTQVRVRYVGPASEAPLTFAETQSTEPVAARSSEAAPVDGVSFVQMGAFSSRANAERLRDQSMSRGRVLIKETPQPDGRPLYRVMLGSASGTTHANTKTPDRSSDGLSGGRVLASLN
jgi:rare lipoprotein A